MEELIVLKQLFSNLPDNKKQEFLASIQSEISLTEPSELINAMPTSCPHCGGIHIKKNGKVNGIQRYICKDCHKTFGNTHKTILKSSKKDLATWKLYVHCMVEKYSLRKCAQKCNISLPTAFAWRHKILDALQNMMAEVNLNGVVEADETFTQISYKGNHKSFKLPRKSFKRGSKASKRGLSKEKVCIPCGINLNGMSIAKISNLGKPKWTDIQNVLGGRIEKGSILVTDSFRGYQKISYDMNLEHIRIPRNKHQNGIFNIQLLNNYHSQLKGMINIRFKGVATKYLNNYLVYHNFVNFAKETANEKKDILFRFIQKTLCISKTCDIRKRCAIPVLSDYSEV